MRPLLAALLIAHGIAHMVGFVVPWRLVPNPDLSDRTTVFGGVLDLGETGMKVFGLLWLALAVGFLTTGGLLLTGSWAGVWVVRLAALSLVLCIVGWPDTHIGIAVNTGIILALFAFGPLSPS